MEEENVERSFVKAAQKNRELAMELKDSNLELHDLMYENIELLVQKEYIKVSVNWKRIYEE